MQEFVNPLPRLNTVDGFISADIDRRPVQPFVKVFERIEKFFAFGNSIFSTDTPRFVINEHSGNYLWFMDDYLLSSNGMEPAALYDFRTDSLCRRNILTKKKDVAQGKMIPYFRAFMQLYRSSVINNRLTVQTLNR